MPVENTPQGTIKGAVPKTAAQRRRLKKIHVQPTDNGGYVVTHTHQPEHGGTPGPARHVFTSYDDMHTHVEAAMKGHA